MKNGNIIRKLEKRYTELIEDYHPSIEDVKHFGAFVDRHELLGVESWFCPDTKCYSLVLEHLLNDDVVLDVGAGDLRFAILISEKVKKVYAIEVNPSVLGDALKTIGPDLPRNVISICANIFDVDVPHDATSAVILMRHCVPSHREVLLKKFAKLKVIHNFGGKVQVIK